MGVGLPKTKVYEIWKYIQIHPAVRVYVNGIYIHKYPYIPKYPHGTYPVCDFYEIVQLYGQ